MTDALRKTADDSYVLATVAQQFWLEGKPAQARKWFQRATHAAPNIGDHYAIWYKFEQQHGTQHHIDTLHTLVLDAKPKYGLLWPQIRKDPKYKDRTNVDVLKLVADKIVPLK